METPHSLPTMCSPPDPARQHLPWLRTGFSQSEALIKHRAADSPSAAMILQDAVSTCSHLPKTLSSMNCIPTAKDLSSGWMLLKHRTEIVLQRWMFPSLVSHEALRHLTPQIILQPNRGPQAVPVYINVLMKLHSSRPDAFSWPWKTC